jgi:hypothetical protein
LVRSPVSSYPIEFYPAKHKSDSDDRCDQTAVTTAMASTSDAPLAFLHKNPVFSGLSDVYNAFQERRERLGLSNPGMVENIAKGTSQPWKLTP